ncbi:MAG TPA: valine--pyruvate transaminase [Verrucomicrobiales bacterium]|mgnify:CR=1 FL=1|nr:valine--pyruvate transaminase [Verrucomicrobiales bacterium]
MSRYPKTLFAESLTGHSGTLELMDDLGAALALHRDRMRLLGGGNPAHIPAVQAVWRQAMADLLADGPRFDSVLADYDQPAGNPRFREAVAGYLNRECGWKLTREHIGVTSGGQTAFFLLLNRFAGTLPDGSRRRVLLPVVPEYIGYSDQGVAGSLFQSCRPRIDLLGDREFKYHVDFEKVCGEFPDPVGAITVSRPTNPSSNVLTDDEIRRLAALAKQKGVPFILDNAYGLPFPGVIFEDVTPIWTEDMILTLSLSKIGLPGTRTGIVVAHPDIIREVAAMNAIVGLANNNLGQALTLGMIESGEIGRLSREVVRPFYAGRARFAISLMHENLPADLPWRLHRSEGAFFLWLWLPGLPVSARELYQRLKARDVIVVPGEHFFFGLDAGSDDWPHRRECLRISFGQPETILRQGIEILGQEVRRAYSEKVRVSSDR